MTVVSITDQVLRQQLGDSVFEALLQARGSRSPGWEDTRSRRVQEAVTGVAWRKPPPAPMPPATTPPAWSKTKPTTAKRRWPWTVECRPDAKPRHTIRLSYEGCRAIEANAALAAAAGVETGGYGWTFRPTRLTGREAIVDLVTGPPPGSRHSRRASLSWGRTSRGPSSPSGSTPTRRSEVDRSIALARAKAV